MVVLNDYWYLIAHVYIKNGTKNNHMVICSLKGDHLAVFLYKLVWMTVQIISSTGIKRSTSKPTSEHTHTQGRQQPT